MLPCCGYKLRTTPRNVNLNAKLREQSAIEEAQKLRVIISGTHLSKNKIEATS
jgi:hypothetical protein